MQERRDYSRAPLDTPYFARLIIDENISTSALLIDVSRGGLQLGVSPEQVDTVRLLGKEVVVEDLPRGIDAEGQGFACHVTWVSSNRFGVRFVDILLPDSLDLPALLHSL